MSDETPDGNVPVDPENSIELETGEGDVVVSTGDHVEQVDLQT